MPTHCCVPGCTKKGYRDDDGSKISYYLFPSDKSLKKQWTHAIRREEGKHFQINSTTSVCSRHFKPEDFRVTLAGKRYLKRGVVPSVFSWRTSPRKRKLPAPRNFDFSTKIIPNRSDSSTKILPNSLAEIEEEQLSKNVSTQTDNTLLQDTGTQTEEIILANQETQIDNNEEMEFIEKKIQSLQSRIENLSTENDNLQGRLFKIENLCSKPSSVSFYTGFENYDVFMAVFNYLDPGKQGQNITYWSSVYNSDDKENSNVKSEKGRPRKLSVMDEYFLVMCRVRQGFPEEHLGHLFDVSISTVSRIVISWVNFMYLKFSQICIWPSRETIDNTMPEAFKEKYNATRVIIDCTEVRCQMPSSLQLNGELFSNYKNHTTLKGLVGISPGGAVTFVSELYTGSISDREIVIRSGFLDLPFNDKDLVLADKGFTIDDLLRPKGVDVRLPPFLGSSSQMPAEDVILTQEIASLRIHVERAINKIKNFHVWDRVVPIHQLGLANQMWAVCAFLCNIQPNIISV